MFDKAGPERARSSELSTIKCWLAPTTLVLALSLTGGVQAMNWTIDDSTSFAGGYVDRDGDAEQDGFVAGVTPRLLIDGQGPRSEANVNFAPTLAAGTDDTDPRALTLEMRATGSFDVVENAFTLRGNAGAGLEADEGTVGDIDAISVNSDGAQFYTAAILPEFLVPLNDDVQFFSNNAFDAVWYSNQKDDRDDNDDSVGAVLNLGVGSRPNSGLIGWQIAGTYDYEDFDNRDSETRRDVIGTGSYRLNPIWTLLVDVGYEDNDVNTARNDTSGTVFGGGFIWTPNPRNRAEFRYQDRYFGDLIDATYSLRSRRTRLVLGASRDVESRRTDQLLENSFFLADEDGNAVVDPTTGAPVVVTDSQTLALDEDYVTERLRALIVVQGLRTRFQAGGSVSNRDYEISNRDEDLIDVDAAVTRDINPRWSATLSGRYEERQREIGADTDFYRATLGVTRKLGPETDVTVNLSYRERNSDDAAEEYEENRVGLIFTTSFL